MKSIRVDWGQAMQMAALRAALLLGTLVGALGQSGAPTIYMYELPPMYNEELRGAPGCDADSVYSAEWSLYEGIRDSAHRVRLAITRQA